MLSLAAKYNDGTVAVAQIAAEQGLSRKYLEYLIRTLKGAGLVISVRGKRGGYALARPPAEISLLDVLSPLEESLSVVHCTESKNGCNRSAVCVTRSVWMEIKDATDEILSRTTLADLLERQRELEAGQSA